MRFLKLTKAQDTSGILLVPIEDIGLVETSMQNGKPISLVYIVLRGSEELRIISVAESCSEIYEQIGRYE